MTIKKRTFAIDGDWQDFRCGEYYTLLRETADIWLHILERFSVSSKAYKRATLALPQLPLEFDCPDNRFERSRWRHESVVCGEPTTAHCEHPWTKKGTRQLVENYAISAINKGIQRDSIVSGIATIIDMRQDTILLPSQSTVAWGVGSGSGLADRYSDVADKIIDRKTGARLSAQEIRNIESYRSDRISMATSCNIADNGV